MCIFMYASAYKLCILDCTNIKLMSESQGHVGCYESIGTDAALTLPYLLSSWVCVCV